MKKFTVAILGCGGRGVVFAQNMVSKINEGKFEITALCDPNREQIDNILKLCDCVNPEIFLDVDEFFKKKRADIMVIATPDRCHVPQAIKALKLGYDLLLEKPISDNIKELKALLKVQKQTGKQVVVCHELRYGPGFLKCSELAHNGTIGKLYAIDASERVWFAHWAQAYVRGIGADIKRSHPVILAKCSHDLDLIQGYAKSKCKTISSVGGLDYFIPQNAPEGAADRCLDCKHKDTCVYSAKKIYLDSWFEAGKPAYKWPYYKVTTANPHTEQAIIKGLREGENGRCVYKCKVDKVDHQFVQMTFENGVKASLKMVYCHQAGRRIAFYGTLGEIVFDERTNTIEVRTFGKATEVIDVNILVPEDQNHGGGDAALVMELYDILSGNKESLTPLSESIESHLMGIAAEKSRKHGGKLVKVH